MDNKHKIKLNEIIEYLELKLLSDVNDDDEYYLYSEYKWNGREVFKDKIHSKTVKRLMQEIREGGIF